MALSNAERQRLFRIRQAHRGVSTIKVKGEGGYFDERIRIGLAIRAMAIDGIVDKKFIQMLLDYAIEAIPPKDLVDERYIRAELENYLGGLLDGEKH